MSKKVKIEPVRSSESASLYTIIFEDGDVSEFAKFLNHFKDNGKLQRDYQLILYALQKILENGVQERYFRPEGKYADRVCALPIDSGKLRLYCLRISDKISPYPATGANSHPCSYTPRWHVHVPALPETDEILSAPNSYINASALQRTVLISC